MRLLFVSVVEFCCILFLLCGSLYGSETVEQILSSGVAESRFNPFITIGILTKTSSFTIEGDGTVSAGKRRVGVIQGKYPVSQDGKGHVVIGKNIRTGTGSVTIRPKFSFMLVNGRIFRGEVIIHAGSDGFTVVNNLHLEDYIRGVINSEVIPSWPLAAKKAQAVLARTYAVYEKMFSPASDLYALAPSVLDQVYSGIEKEDLSANRAVDLTRGEVITYRNRPARIFFHSTCGGRTASAKEVWGSDIPYLKSVKCRYCKSSSLYRWRRVLSRAALEKKLKKAQLLDNRLRSLSVKRGKTRVRTVLVNGNSVPVNRFRAAAGYSVVWSNDFSIRKRGGSWEFRGRGAGHGVGVCQWGMAQQAKQGVPYADILQYYLPGTAIKKLY